MPISCLTVGPHARAYAGRLALGLARVSWEDRAQRAGRRVIAILDAAGLATFDAADPDLPELLGIVFIGPGGEAALEELREAGRAIALVRDPEDELAWRLAADAARAWIEAAQTTTAMLQRVEMTRRLDGDEGSDGGLLYTLYQRSSGPAFILSPERLIVDVNTKARELFGRDDLIGRPLWSLALIKDEQRRMEDALEQSLTGDLARVRAAIGQQLFEFVITAHKTREDELVVWMIYARDVTELEQAVRSARRYEQQLRLFVEQAPAAVLMTDAELCVLLASRRWAELFGLSGGLRGRPIEDALPAIEARERWLESARAAIAGRAFEPCTDGFRSEDGRRVWVRWRPLPWRRDEGELGGILVLVEDITERRDAELALRSINEELERRVEERTRALEAASQAKSEFLASMSHEIRTPLNAILGFTQLLQDDLRETPAESRLAIIHHSGEHLLGIIEDVLSMARLEAGRVDLNRIPLDLTTFLREIASMFSLRAQEKGLSFRLDVTDREVQVSADASKLRQILVNLIGNAIKFTEAGGVTVSAELRVDDRGGLLRIRVEDTGPGISEAERELVFEPFAQAESVRRVGGGTGLGLAICQRLAHIMGGRLELESELGVGSAFIIEVPTELCEPRAVSGSSERLEVAFEGRSRPRIMVVDDNSPNRELLRDILERVGFRASTASDGRQALDQCGQDEPDLIIMDLKMPGIDGFEATRRLREGGFDGPILTFTASATIEDHERALDAGANAVLCKPLPREAIVRAICTHLELRLKSLQSSGAWLRETQGPGPDLSASLPDALRDELRQLVRLGHLLELRRRKSELEAALGDAAQTLLIAAERFDYAALYAALGLDVDES